MFSFASRKKVTDLHPYVRRLCDLTAPNLATLLGEGGERTENRYNRTIPTLLAPWLHERATREKCMVGLTSDVADRGIGLVLSQPIRADSVVVGYWISREVMPRPWFFLGNLRRNQPIGGGFWKVGIELTEFANADHAENLAVLEPVAAKLLPPTAASTAQPPPEN